MADEVIDLSQATRAATVSRYLDIEMIEGLRAGSKLLYCLNDRMLYTKQHVGKKNTLYSCRVKGCKARVCLMPNGLCQKPDKFIDHSHYDMREEYEELLIRKDFRELATDPRNPDATIQSAYHNVTSKLVIIIFSFLASHIVRSQSQYLKKKRLDIL